MPIQIVQGNVLDASADALLLTIDGARRGLEGNITRAFARRWPDAFEEIEDQVPYPVPLGRTVATWPESECPFPLILVASTLHHVDILTEPQKAGVIAGALREAVALARRHGRRTIASAVMSGGWRLPFEAALGTMLDSLRSLASHDAGLRFVIHVLSETDFASAKALASAKGIALLDVESGWGGGANTERGSEF